MQPQVTNRELARRISQVMVVVVLGTSALGYMAGIEILTLLWIQAQFVAFSAVVFLQFMRREQQREKYDTRRLIFSFLLVPLMMGAVSFVYLRLRLPPVLGILAFPFVVLGVNSLYSVWMQNRGTS